jgi:hypothetical protein
MSTTQHINFPKKTAPLEIQSKRTTFKKTADLFAFLTVQYEYVWQLSSRSRSRINLMRLR